MDMKRTSFKKHRNFKLDPKVDTLLRKESARSNRTQTVIVELALKAFLARATA